MRVSGYASQLSISLRSQDAQKIAMLLKLNHSHVSSLIADVKNAYAAEQQLNSIEAPWNEIAIHHLRVATASAKQNHELAYSEENALAQIFLRLFSTGTNWLLPVLYVVMRDLRNVAMQADADAERFKTPGTTVARKLEDAARTINKAFNYCITDRSPMETSRKWGTYYIIGILFKTYFKLKSQSLSKNVLRAVSVAELPPLEAFPKSHQVTFRYYMGILSFLNEDYKKAEVELMFAYNKCHRSYTRNKELILTYLIPTLLVRGILPSQSALKLYPRLQSLYSPLVAAIRLGNIKAYDQALFRAERRLIEAGTYLTVERARNVCMRILFKKVYLLKEGATRIPIDAFRTALQFVGINIGTAEVECMLANMIYKGYIKGYLSHEKLMMVVSAKSAFPPLTSVA